MEAGFYWVQYPDGDEDWEIAQKIYDAEDSDWFLLATDSLGTTSEFHKIGERVLDQVKEEESNLQA